MGYASTYLLKTYRIHFRRRMPPSLLSKRRKRPGPLSLCPLPTYHQWTGEKALLDKRLPAWNVGNCGGSLPTRILWHMGLMSARTAPNTAFPRPSRLQLDLAQTDTGRLPERLGPGKRHPTLSKDTRGTASHHLIQTSKRCMHRSKRWTKQRPQQTSVSGKRRQRRKRHVKPEQ